MISGQGGYKLATHGGRVPIPWIIGTSGWAIFVHQPYGTFDFTGQRGKFHTDHPGGALDLFFVGSADPATIMAEYARLTGLVLTPTAHVPAWGSGPATIEITGEVPDPTVRDVALRVARDEAARLRPDVQIVDRLSVRRVVAA